MYRDSLWARFCRMMSTVFFAASIFCTIMDIIAFDERAVQLLRPLGAVWLLLDAKSLNSVYHGLYARGMNWMWDSVLQPILSQSGLFVFGCLALFFLALAWLTPARRRRRRTDHDDPRYDRRSH